MEGSLYEKELVVSVLNSDQDRKEGGRGMEEEEHNQPFIVEVITELKLAVEVGEIRGA